MPDSGSHLVVGTSCTLYIVSGFRLRSVGRLWPITLELSLVSLAPSWTLMVVGGIADRDWLQSVQGDAWHQCDTVGQL